MLCPPTPTPTADAFGADEEDSYADRFGTQFAERILELGRVTKVGGVRVLGGVFGEQRAAFVYVSWRARKGGCTLSMC